MTYQSARGEPGHLGEVTGVRSQRRAMRCETGSGGNATHASHFCWLSALSCTSLVTTRFLLFEDTELRTSKSSRTLRCVRHCNKVRLSIPPHDRYNFVRRQRSRFCLRWNESCNLTFVVSHTCISSVKSSIVLLIKHTDALKRHDREFVTRLLSQCVCPAPSE